MTTIPAPGSAKNPIRVSRTQLAQAMIRGGGKATTEDGVTTVTGGKALVFEVTKPTREKAPASVPRENAPASRTTPRESRSRRVQRDRSPPSGDDGPSDLARPEVGCRLCGAEVAAIRAEVLRLTRPHVPDEVVCRRLWAQIVLALDLDTCQSIGAGRPVMAGRLDAEVLRRALRGAPLPDPQAYIVIGPEHLDSAAEAGPLRRKTGKRRRRKEAPR